MYPQLRCTKRQCAFVLGSLLLATICAIIVLIVFIAACSPITYDPKILVIGGYDAKAASSMEFYHPFNARGNHILPVKLMQPRRSHTSALMSDGSVITVGGKNVSNRAPLIHCERFNPNTATVTQCASLNSARAFHASTVLGGFLFVCGGHGATNVGILDSCEYLLSNVWQYSLPMSCPRLAFSMVSLHGYLYVIGGYNSSGVSLSSVERRSIDDKYWTSVQSMRHRRHAHSSAVMQNKIFVCGGLGGRDTCEQFDPLQGVWLEIKQMLQPRMYFGLVAVQYYLYAVSGNTDFVTVEMFNAMNHTWTMVGKLIYKRSASSFVLIP